jgi:acyl phosphate:glycerol-3-phosphate acyltransferase
MIHVAMKYRSTRGVRCIGLRRRSPQVMSPHRFLIAAAGGYVLGTFPSADLAARLASGGSIDLRSSGSRNPGGMNARRMLGPRAGGAVVATDVVKGVAACALGRRIAGDSGAHAAGVAAVAGHCYPLWTRFRGGKGVATSFGQCLYTFPAYAPVDIAVAIGAARLPGLRRPALASVAISSLLWLLASVLWWRRRLPNLWGPRPTAALPLANTATVLVIATRGVALLLRRETDELALPR